MPESEYRCMYMRFEWFERSYEANGLKKRESSPLSSAKTAIYLFLRWLQIVRTMRIVGPWPRELPQQPPVGKNLNVSSEQYLPSSAGNHNSIIEKATIGHPDYSTTHNTQHTTQWLGLGVNLTTSMAMAGRWLAATVSATHKMLIMS